MALTPAEIANAPTIMLAGRPFHIPRLAIKQNRVVVAGLKVLLPLLGDLERVANEAKATIAANGSDAAAAVAGLEMIKSFPMEGAAFDIVCDIVYAAITRGDPAFTRAEFDDLPTGVDELLLAIPTVMAQSFAFARKGDLPPGEAQPAAQPATTQN